MRREGRRQDQGRTPTLPQAQAALNLFSNSEQMRISGGHSSERLTLGTEGTRDHWVPWGQSLRLLAGPGRAWRWFPGKHHPLAYSSSHLTGTCLRFLHTRCFPQKEDDNAYVVE